jgi:hypothetical protein
MDMGWEGVLKLAAITTAKVGQETSTMMGILVEEEEVKIRISTVVVAPSVTAITKAKVRVTVSEVEVTTTTRATVGDEHSIAQKPMWARWSKCNLTLS